MKTLMQKLRSKYRNLSRDHADKIGSFKEWAKSQALQVESPDAEPCREVSGEEIIREAHLNANLAPVRPRQKKSWNKEPRTKKHLRTKIKAKNKKKDNEKE